MINKDIFAQNIKAASKLEKCDLVIKNINVVDVFQCDVYTADVAIKNGHIVGIGDYYGINEIDARGKYICPGLIDAHVHIESSLVTPVEYYKAALLNGVTSVITDPHEIANVMGIEGINLMLDSSENLPLDVYFMLSSCVPATEFESSGARLDSENLKPLYTHPRVLGLGEVMDSPKVVNANEEMISKIWDAKANDLTVDGHCAGLNMDALNAYICANITTDHECHCPSEVIDRLRRGMYVLIREGSVAKNLKELIGAVNIYNSRRVCFCTDDKHLDDLLEKGSINSCIQMAAKLGLKIEIALQMATLNAAECYKLYNKGAIAPGYVADFIILNDLNSFNIDSVYKNGKLVVKDKALVEEYSDLKYEFKIKNSIKMKSLTSEDLKIDLRGKSVINVIEIIPNKLESKHLKIQVTEMESKDEFIADIKNDLVKIAVIERHKGTGEIGLGVLSGLRMKCGAIATTIAHDSHNIIVTGCSDLEMLTAVEKLRELGGGIVVVKGETILAFTQLEIAGLMTCRKSIDVISDMNRLHQAIKDIAPDIDFNPFLTLSFLSLPVIPDIKISNKGLFDVINFKFIDVVE